MATESETLACAAWESLRGEGDAAFADVKDKARLIHVAGDVLHGVGDETPFADACRAIVAEWDRQEAHVALVAAALHADEPVTPVETPEETPDPPPTRKTRKKTT